MRLRWRKRPSATVLHLRVLMTVGSALPLAIRASRPVLSIGARQPVSAVFAAAWDIVFCLPVISGIMKQNVLFHASSVPSFLQRKKRRGFRGGGRPAAGTVPEGAQKAIRRRIN